MAKALFQFAGTVCGKGTVKQGHALQHQAHDW